jgi:hypothetical protein
MMKFGDPEAYYSQHPLHMQPLDMFSDREAIIRLIERYHPEAKGRVEASVKRWRPYIVEKLKQETGLKLKHNKTSAKTVSVKVVTSIPPALIEKFAKVDSFFWRFLLNSRQYDQAENIIKTLSKDSSSILDHLKIDKDLEPNVPEACSTLIELLAAIRKNIQSSGIDKALEELGLDQLLGAYFYKRPLIEIYWPSIAVFANQLNCSIEELTFVVLAHEMAHYTTHHCFDLEGELWNTEHFANSDLKIVEGMAQHYTQLICADLENNHYNPYMKKAFDSLLKCQRDEYTTFSSWLQNERNRNEAIRLTLINVRKNRVVDYNKFIGVLDRSKSALSSHNS